jgi:hypothetical protein
MSTEMNLPENPTEAQVAERLLAEGQMEQILAELKPDYDVVAFRTTTPLIPASIAFGPNFPADQSTFGLPTKEWRARHRSGRFIWPPLWGAVERAVGLGSCGNGHQYQVAPACGPRVFVKVKGEWEEVK